MEVLRPSPPRAPLLQLAARALLACVCGALLAACSDSVPRTANDANADAPLDGGDLTFPSCGPTISEPALVGTLDGSPHPPVPRHRVDGATIVWQSADGDSAQAGDVEVFRFDLSADAVTRVTDNTTADWLVDAFDGAILLYRQGDDGSLTLELVRQSGSRVIASGLPTPGLSLETTPASRALSDEGVLYVGPGDATTGRPSRLHLWSEERGDSVLFEAQGQIVGPDIEGGDVVFAASVGPNYEIRASRAADRAAGRGPHVLSPPGPAYAQAPQVSSGHVFWLHTGQPAVASLDGGAATVIDRACTRHAAGGGRAVFVCTDEPGPFSQAPRELVLVDSDGTARVLLTRTGDVPALAFDGAALAWVEYPTDLDFSRPGRGMIHYLSDVDATSPSVVDVSDVGTGCWWCDAYWPPPEIALSERLVAWNYAGPPWDEPSPDFRDLGIGYAVLSASAPPCE